MKIQFQISKTETFTEFAEIVDIYGQGCSYVTSQGVDGFQVDFTVIATKDTESREFVVVFQSEDRTDNLKAYNGYEMTTASRYGCDADESNELEQFSEYLCDDFLTQLETKANNLCEEWFLENQKKI